MSLKRPGYRNTKCDTGRKQASKVVETLKRDNTKATIIQFLGLSRRRSGASIGRGPAGDPCPAELLRDD